MAQQEWDQVTTHFGVNGIPRARGKVASLGLGMGGEPNTSA